MGTVNPVFRLSSTARGSGRLGVAESARFPLVGDISPSAATSRHRLQSTSGTRTSTECVIDAQSASRKSWLRMYQVASSALTIVVGTHPVKVPLTRFRIIVVS